MILSLSGDSQINLAAAMLAINYLQLRREGPTLGHRSFGRMPSLPLLAVPLAVTLTTPVVTPGNLS